MNIMTEFVAIALVVDLLLSATLIMYWVVNRDAWHAFWFGVGQFAFGSMTLIWLVLRQSGLGWWYPLISLLLFLGVVSYGQATRYLVLRRKQAMPRYLQLLWGGLLLCLIVTSFLDSSAVRIGLNIGARVLIMLWAGWSLFQQRAPAYRMLGGLFLLRAGFNALYLVVRTESQSLMILLVMTYLAELVSVLCMVYLILKEASRQFPNAVKNMAVPVWIHDTKGYIQFCNQACADFFQQASPKALEQHHVQEYLPGLSPEPLADLVRQLQSPETVLPLRKEVVAEPFDDHPVSRDSEVFLSPLLQDGRLLVLAQLHDISARKRHEQQLFQAANVDVVTGLANRHALTARLASSLTPNGEPQAHALFFVNIDHFKRINDSLGHRVGDQLLQSVGRRLVELVGPEAMVARFGGDEFVVLLPLAVPASYLEPEVLGFAQTLNQGFQQAFDIAGIHLLVTSSIGAAHFPVQASTADELLRFADSAMYHAKHKGQNQIALFRPEMEEALRDALQLDNELRLALERNEFHLVYQPIVEARTHALSKVEALIRWQSPSLGLVSPDRFIPVAEESGLIVPLGLWVLREACRQLGQWQQDYPELTAELTVSVNISAWQLADAHFLRDIAEALAEGGIQAANLELELTERILIEEDPAIMSALRTLQALGIKLALDDFGTGYSSLNYLSRMELNTLKIDRSFIKELETSQRSRDLTRHIIGMGQSLGLTLISEGVESQLQADMLCEFGCNYLQGYLFSKPLLPDHLAEHYLKPKAAVIPLHPRKA